MVACQFLSFTFSLTVRTEPTARSKTVRVLSTWYLETVDTMYVLYLLGQHISKIYS